MRCEARMIFTALLLTASATLGACGKDDKTSNTVQMKDLEVVDGTTTDAMTDLDGVQSEAPSAASQSEPTAANATRGEAEVLSDQ
jgi:ABC-type uncharacterized transport system auxiliary subunit